MISKKDIYLSFINNTINTVRTNSNVDLSNLFPLDIYDITILSLETNVITKKLMVYLLIKNEYFLTLILKDQNIITKKDVFIFIDLERIKNYLQKNNTRYIGYRIKELVSRYPEIFYI
jgi:hypothetical protein